MPSISNLATNADLNAKINEVKGEISGVNTLFKESRLWCKRIRNGKKILLLIMINSWLIYLMQR